MSFVRTLVLLVVAAALGSWFWLVEVPNIEKEARADFLLDIDPAAVEKVRLAYPDGTAIEAVRSGGEWNLTSPVEYPAENSVIDGFLGTVQETKIERRMEAGEAGDLSSYGLEGETGSQARLEITTTGGKALPAVILGGTTPVGYQAFARREDSDAVLVIPLLLQSSAKKEPDDVRRKSMFGSEARDVRRLTIEKPGETIVVERGDDGDWTMTSPLEDAADTEAVRSVIDSLGTIDALGFYDGERADREAFGLKDGAIRFVAGLADGGTLEFRIGKEATDPPAGNYFERTSDGQVVKVPDWVPKKFAPPADELRQRRLLSCQADDIVSLTWGSPTGSFTISREAAGKPWSIEPAVETEVLNPRIVDNAVRGLVLARADEVVGDAASDADLANWGLDTPTASFEARTRDGSCASLIGATRDDPAATPAGAPSPRGPRRSYYVKSATRPAILRASQHEYSRIAMKRSEFVDAAPKESAGAPEAAGGD